MDDDQALTILRCGATNDDQLVAAGRQRCGKDDHAKVPLLEFDQQFDHLLAAQPYKIADFVRPNCQRLIQPMIKLKQWHRGVIHLRSAVVPPGCRCLIVSARFVA
jgi:hypothetical protein